MYMVLTGANSELIHNRTSKVWFYDTDELCWTDLGIPTRTREIRCGGVGCGRLDEIRPTYIHMYSTQYTIVNIYSMCPG